jgi:hypothetical protein
LRDGGRRSSAQKREGAALLRLTELALRRRCRALLPRSAAAARCLCRLRRAALLPAK